MRHRHMISLDEATARRVVALAAEWRVRPEEVLRRLAAAAPTCPDPIAKLDALHREGNGLDRDQGLAYLDVITDDRAEWRR